MFKKLTHWLRAMVLSGATAKEVAGGLAIGTFIAFTPTLGLHTWIALPIAAIFKKNKIATIIGVYVTNPLTVIPIFYSNLRIGEFLLGRDIPLLFTKETLLDWRNMGVDLLAPLWVGSLLSGAIFALLAYALCITYYDRWVHALKNRLHKNDPVT